MDYDRFQSLTILKPMAEMDFLPLSRANNNQDYYCAKLLAFRSRNLVLSMKWIESLGRASRDFYLVGRNLVLSMKWIESKIGNPAIETVKSQSSFIYEMD